jgi:hypothetical protein
MPKVSLLRERVPISLYLHEYSKSTRIFILIEVIFSFIVKGKILLIFF